MPSDVAIDTERQVEKWMPAATMRSETGEHGPGTEPVSGGKARDEDDPAGGLRLRLRVREHTETPRPDTGQHSARSSRFSGFTSRASRYQNVNRMASCVNRG